jgi:hypothetical protein
LFVLKYDWYDPKTKISGSGLSNAAGFSKADLRFDTVGMGYVFVANESLKFTFYYDLVRNESSALTGFQKDVRDDVLTCRVQYSF